MEKKLSRNNHKFYLLNDRSYLILFLAPAVIALIVFSIFPLIYSLKISFYNWNLIKPETSKSFIGFTNYINIFKSPSFWKSLVVTAKFMIGSVIGSMIIGIAMAFLLYQNLRGTKIVTTLIISAMVTTPVVIGTAWRLMYNPSWGLINYLLGLIGIRGRAFLAQSSTVIPALIVTDVWQWSPLVMLIVSAALYGLPQDIYEAADVEGASNWSKFWYITIPLLKPSLLLALLLRVMDSIRAFDLIFAMTGGGPGSASQNLNILIYNTTFEFFKVSKGAALAILSLIIIIILCSSLFEIFRGGN